MEKGSLMKEGFISSHTSRVLSMVVERHGSRIVRQPHCIHTQEGGRGGEEGGGRFPFSQSRTSVHWIVPPTFRCGFNSSVKSAVSNPSVSLNHNEERRTVLGHASTFLDTKEFFSAVILNPMKLTMKINRHTWFYDK